MLLSKVVMSDVNHQRDFFANLIENEYMTHPFQWMMMGQLLVKLELNARVFERRVFHDNDLAEEHDRMLVDLAALRKEVAKGEDFHRCLMMWCKLANDCLQLTYLLPIKMYRYD